MTNWVGVIFRDAATGEVALTPLKDVVGNDNIVDGVATLHFADGSTDVVRGALGYYRKVDVLPGE